MYPPLSGWTSTIVKGDDIFFTCDIFSQFRFKGRFKPLPGGDKRHKLDIKIPKTSYTSLLSAVLVGLQQFYRIKLLWRTTCSALLVVSMEMIRTAALLLCLCGNACLAQDFR